MAPSTWDRMKPAHIVPPVFVSVIVGTILAVYGGLHVAPLLQLGVPLGVRDVADVAQGMAHGRVFAVITGLMVLCYARTVLVDPGGLAPRSRAGVRTSSNVWEDRFETKESKMCGGQRYCKWCNMYKPDRTHHCRICERCVLKMDHHCPWIMSCVGFRNHKFFFLLIFYGAVDCVFVVATMSESVHDAVIEETLALDRFLLVLGMTLSVIMGILCSGLTAFHMHLMLRGMTTIEFCEKAAGGGKGPSYDHGYYANICSVLGPHPPFWLLPFSSPAGDGMTWTTSSPLSASLVCRDNAADPEWTGEVAIAQ